MDGSVSRPDRAGFSVVDVSPCLLRLSIGLEHADDLAADLAQARDVL